MRRARTILLVLLLVGLSAACDGGGGGGTTGPTGPGQSPSGPVAGGPPSPSEGAGDGGGSGGGSGSGGGGQSLSVRRFRAVEILVTPPTGGTVSDNFAANGSIVQDCTRCVERYQIGTHVRLLAEPNPGFRFERWEGSPCDATPRSICSLTVEADTRITAVFR